MIQYSPTETGSAYDSLILKIKIEIPKDFPNIPPSVYFLDIIYHLNINQKTGEVSLPILKEEWCPYFSIASVIEGIDEVLAEPDKNTSVNKMTLK